MCTLQQFAGSLQKKTAHAHSCKDPANRCICPKTQKLCRLSFLPIFSPIMLCSIICSASALLFFPSSYLLCSLYAHLCSSNSHQKSTHATIFVAFGSEYCDPWLDPWLGSSVSHCQTSVSSQPIMTKLCSLL